jgi:hypothetical protein
MVDYKILEPPIIPPKPPDQFTWAKPPENQVRVNFNGAFDQNTGSRGWGYVICDQADDFIAAGSGKTVHLRDPLHSEAVACLATVNGVIRIGANRIVFESVSSLKLSLNLTKRFIVDKSVHSVHLGRGPVCEYWAVCGKQA